MIPESCPLQQIILFQLWCGDEKCAWTGNIIVVDGNLSGIGYIDILAENLNQSVKNMFVMQEHPFIFQDDNAPPYLLKSKLLNRMLEMYLKHSKLTKLMAPTRSVRSLSKKQVKA
jgi:hypothetical protein